MGKELILSGKVQGVFCREYCSQNARKLNLKGSATNLPDATVRVILDTQDEEKVIAFTKALMENPYQFRFYGTITHIAINEFSGTLFGDYLF